MTAAYQVYPIGRIEKQESRTWIKIDSKYQDAIKGLEGFSHINVLFWFHENDTPEQRKILQVRPRKDPKNPLTGVFATHSPVRPNLVGLTRCEIISIQDTTIEIKEIDARDNTPVIDIKCYIPSDKGGGDVGVPEWV